jgi:uncharacterized protein (TIGR02466 family)
MDDFAAAATAHQRGDLASARRLYRKVLKRQPHHWKALRLAGLASQALGKSDEALQLLGAAVRHAPRDVTLALEDLALMHLQRAEHEQAEALLRRALVINPDSLSALMRLGSALITSGQAAEAVTVFERARALGPDDPGVVYSLAHALLESREFEAAVSVCDDALAKRPEDAASLTVKGVALAQLERFDVAAAALTHAVAVDPRDMMTWLHLGLARQRLEDAAGAIAAFEQAAALAPDSPMAHSQLANAYSASGQPGRALAICDAYLERHPGDSGITVVKVLALREAGRTEEADALAGLETLIQQQTIEAPPGYANLEAFNAALQEAVLAHPDLARTHTNRATRHGVQTGSLTFNPSPPIEALFGVIDRELRAARARLVAAGFGQHPWIAHAPTRWRVNAWAVVLESQGHQLAHVHPEAWMSGCYYVALPESGMGPAQGQDGWIEFGRPSAQLFHAAESPVVAVEPRPGRMVLFPSYTFHRTIPFTGAGKRVCVAFDVFAH